MDLPPSGPSRSIDVQWGTDEERELAIQLRNMLHQFHIVTPIDDDVLHQTFHNFTEFIDDLNGYMTTPHHRNAVLSNLGHLKRIVGIANEQNARLYEAIVNTLNQLERADENANERAASTVPRGARSALQWTALERLMNLMDKHIDTQV